MVPLAQQQLCLQKMELFFESWCAPPLAVGEAWGCTRIVGHAGVDEACRC